MESHLSWEHRVLGQITVSNSLRRNRTADYCVSEQLDLCNLLAMKCACSSKLRERERVKLLCIYLSNKMSHASLLSQQLRFSLQISRVKITWEDWSPMLSTEGISSYLGNFLEKVVIKDHILDKLVISITLVRVREREREQEMIKQVKGRKDNPVENLFPWIRLTLDRQGMLKTMPSAIP